MDKEVKSWHIKVKGENVVLGHRQRNRKLLIEEWSIHLVSSEETNLTSVSYTTDKPIFFVYAIRSEIDPTWHLKNVNKQRLILTAVAPISSD